MGVIVFIIGLMYVIAIIWLCVTAGDLMEEKGYGGWFTLISFMFPVLIPFFFCAPYKKKDCDKCCDCVKKD